MTPEGARPATPGFLAQEPDRILIVLLGAIGDVVRGLPLLCRLRRGAPRAKIFWAVEPPAEPLLRHHPALSGTVVFDRPGGAPAFARFLRAVRGLHPELTLDLQRHFKSGVVARVSGAPRRIGFHRRNSREGNFLFQSEHVPAMEHASSKLRQFLSFADYLGVAEAPVEFELRLRPQEEVAVDCLLASVPREFAVFFVGSTAESRLWFPEPTGEVIDAVAARGLGVVLAGGPGEERYAAPIVAAAKTPVTDLTGRTSLRELVGILARARVAVGPDSGPMHIADAVGTPVVSLWGATSAARAAPFHWPHLAVLGRAPCMPCYRKRCPIGRECMRYITPAMVMDRVDRALG